VASPGPKSLKVMLPVGAAPPVRTAVSWMAPPTTTPDEAAVTMVGVSGATSVSVTVALSEAVAVLPAASVATTVTVSVWLAGATPVNRPGNWHV